MRKLSLFTYKYEKEEMVESGFPELDKVTFGWKKWRTDCDCGTSGNGENCIWNVYDTKYCYS